MKIIHKSGSHKLFEVFGKPNLKFITLDSDSLFFIEKSISFANLSDLYQYYKIEPYNLIPQN